MFSRKKDTVIITNLTDRQLQEYQATLLQKNEKHLQRVVDNVLFWFYLGLISAILFFFKIL